MWSRAISYPNTASLSSFKLKRSLFSLFLSLIKIHLLLVMFVETKETTASITRDPLAIMFHPISRTKSRRSIVICINNCARGNCSHPFCHYTRQPIKAIHKHSLAERGWQKLGENKICFERCIAGNERKLEDDINFRVIFLHRELSPLSGHVAKRWMVELKLKLENAETNANRSERF